MIALAGILVLGVLAQWLAWRIRIPAILPLIIIGLMVGPLSTLITKDGSKLINGNEIFSDAENNKLLFNFISLSVGVILFEGGLTLKIKEIRALIGTVRNLLTIGVVVMLLGSAFAAYWLMGFSIGGAMLFGSLMVVTGPTVIGPILRNVRPNKRINTILKWEGILIDPLGALLAVLVFEFIVASGDGQSLSALALKSFFTNLLIGTGIGAGSAYLLAISLRKKAIPEYLLNEVALALVIMAFAISELLAKESGLLTVTIMGILLANTKLEELKKILSFKEEISIILISILFILLSTRVNMEDIYAVLEVKSIILFLIIALLLRPLSVWLSTINAGLNWKERFFIGWVGPKGIVTAAVASLFSLQLIEQNGRLAQDGKLLLPMTFLVIVGTVVMASLTARPLAQRLGVVRKRPQGILFLGANEIARFLAAYLAGKGVKVLLADTSHANIVEARGMGLPVYEGSPLSNEALEEMDLSEIGKLWAVTPNTEINNLTCKKMEGEFGRANVFRLISGREMEFKELIRPFNLLFSAEADYINLSQLCRGKGQIEELTFEDSASFFKLIDEERPGVIPLFTLSKSGILKVISGYPKRFDREDSLIVLKDKALKEELTS